MNGRDAMSKERTEILQSEKKLQKIVRSRRFSQPTPNPKISQHSKHSFFIFRWPGDEIEGILGPPIRNYRRNTSYTLKQEDGSIIEFFGNKYLHEIIDQNNLVGSYVRIKYIGLLAIPKLARSQKIYEVYKITGTQESIQFRKS